MLNHAPVELYYCGSASGDRVQSALSSALADLPKGAVRTVPARPAGHAAPAEPKVVEEALDVTQGRYSSPWASAPAATPGARITRR